ncbi:anti-sigma F factor [Paenalkalicoccus suaedae]|uniref:Anti-sigma F factor n=1 Tax=Paenalkalicoccus suaedae TaxID=2592382 RepID=A0A859FDS2_9BACI|nr:anti-sigma F factor [Paenalkalicoccus suaedae]QKS71030.1 anti-sigma F factor [Paenalkalicoccus suaedae]
MNRMSISFSAKSENESFARVAVAAFVSQLDPSMNELTEIKTVVSEAVTNAIIHGYEENAESIVYVSCEIDEGNISITVEDEGVGIANIEEARQPLYTSKPELERSGMGLTIMENFMDHVEISSVVGEGTRLMVMKKLSKASAFCQ